MKFGDNLKKLRKLKNISQEQLSDSVGVSRQSVSKWETGEAYPEMTNILALCTIFHCKITDLVNDSMTDIDSLDEEVKMSMVKFKKDKQKVMKGLSKAIYIISGIANVLVQIGAWFLVSFMIALPFCIKQIKVTDNTIEAFGKKATYEEIDDKIIFKPIGNDKDVHEFNLTDKDEVIGASHVFEVLRTKSNIVVVGYLEVAFIFILGSMILICLTLKHLEKLFKNINSGDTPFSMENADHIKKMAILMIVNIILPNISAVLIEIVSGTNVNSGFDLINILYILFLFSMAYIFEYGYQIQQDSKGKMYGEIEE